MKTRDRWGWGSWLGLRHWLRQKRSPARLRHTWRMRRGEMLESRVLLHGGNGPHDHDPDYDPNGYHIHAQITISIHGQLVEIPEGVGTEVLGSDQSGRFLSQIHTHGTDEVLHIHRIAGDAPLASGDFWTVGDFFDTWRTKAGVGGNRADAILSPTQIFNNVVDSQNTLKMFVNGVPTTEFQDYQIHGGDNIVLVYGSNPVVTLNTNMGPIVVELFETFGTADKGAPRTVANFLNYANDGRYNNVIFHRSIDNFVLQGGGFTSTAEPFTNQSQFTAVRKDAAVNNEFLRDRSNLRGTIAMAKVGGNPNSATSEFFVNLSNNSANLDNQNGGFTVFGRVLGMWTGQPDVNKSTADVIAELDTRDTEPNIPNSLYENLPLTSDNRVVRINSITGEGEVRGTVFRDNNLNRTRETGEPAMQGVVIFVDANNNGTLDPAETRTTTAADGAYSFRLAAGTYSIRQQVPGGLQQTLPEGNGALSAVVQIGREVNNLNFGNGNLNSRDDRIEVDEDSRDRTLEVLVNDRQENPGVTLTISAVGVPDKGGTVRIASNSQSLIYTPAANFTGEERFTYTVVGPNNFSATPSVFVTVRSVNDPPSAQADSFTIDEDTPTLFNLIQNDQQAPDSGELLRIINVGRSENGATITIEQGGTQVRYTPRANFSGTDTFTYAIADRESGGLTSEATVTVTVREANDNPVPGADAFTVAEDSSGNSFNVLANDQFAPDTGETLRIASIDNSSFSQGGSATVSADGLTISYTPKANFAGTETFVYNLVDSRGGTARGEVTVTVTGSNDPPTAVNDTFTFSKDTPAHSLDVLANDSSLPDTGEMIVIQSVGTTSNGGTVRLINNGRQIEYTSARGFVGQETFTYTIGDGSSLTATATVTVTIRQFTASSLRGSVFFDHNNDGVRDVSGELPIGNVKIMLSGTDSQTGARVNRETSTLADGSYEFMELPPGNYTVEQIQPDLVVDGTTIVGSQGGQAAANRYSIQLAEGINGVNNNFTERGRDARVVTLRDFFAVKQEPTIISATAPGGQTWYSVGNGLTNELRSADVVLASDRSSIDLNLLGLDNTNVRSRIPVSATSANLIDLLPTGGHFLTLYGTDLNLNGASAQGALSSSLPADEPAAPISFSQTLSSPLPLETQVVSAGTPIDPCDSELKAVQRAMASAKDPVVATEDAPANHSGETSIFVSPGTPAVPLIAPVAKETIADPAPTPLPKPSPLDALRRILARGTSRTRAAAVDAAFGR